MTPDPVTYCPCGCAELRGGSSGVPMAVDEHVVTDPISPLPSRLDHGGHQSLQSVWPSGTVVVVTRRTPNSVRQIRWRQLAYSSASSRPANGTATAASVSFE